MVIKIKFAIKVTPNIFSLALLLLKGLLFEFQEVHLCLQLNNICLH